MDAIYTDVTIVCDALDTDAFKVVIQRLRALGLTVTTENDDQSVLEGVIEHHRIHDLESDPNVRYVRRGGSYEANFPPGDPRDRDGR